MLNVVSVNAAQISVNLKVQLQCVDLLLGHVILKSTVLASLLTAQKIVTIRMDLRVMMTRPTATQESARRTMHSAKETLKLVSLLVKQDYVVIFMCNSPDKGIDDCFQLFNTNGTLFGNCGSNGTHYIPCLPRSI